ncbi:MAG: hypothetical protein ACE5J3_12755 [Methanosarcinales archaeon]
MSVKNKVIIFRSCIDLETKYTRDWGGAVVEKLRSEGVQVEDYVDNQASPDNFVKALKDFDPFAIFIFDHGDEYNIYGEEGNKIASLLNINNAELTKGRSVAVLACTSVKHLGLKCIEEGCIVYDGYDTHYNFYSIKPYLSAFKECGTEIFIKLAEGKTFQEGHESAQNKMQQFIQIWITSPPNLYAPYAIAAMLQNMLHHKQLGDGSVSIKP